MTNNYAGHEIVNFAFDSADGRMLSGTEQKQLKIMRNAKLTKELTCPIVSYHERYGENGESCVVCGFEAEAV